MKISHIQTITKPISIIVRNYDNTKIVHLPDCYIKSIKDKQDFELGQWKIKYIEHVPKELNEVIVFGKL